MNLIQGKLGSGSSKMSYFDMDSGILYKVMEDDRVVVEHSAGSHNVIILDGDLAAQVRITLERRQTNKPRI